VAGSRGSWEREQRRIAAELERERRVEERARLAAEKERAQARVAERKAAADLKTADLAGRVDALRSVLSAGLQVPGKRDFDSLLREVKVPPVLLGDLAEPIVPTPWELAEPPMPGLLSRVLGGKKQYQEKWDAARRRYDSYVADVERKEHERQQRVAELQQTHAHELQQLTEAVRQHNDEVERLRRGVPDRHKEAVEAFLRHVLGSISLPDGFPHECEVVFNPAAEQVLVQLSLPPRNVVPEEKAYKYVERSDEERVSARPAREVADIYRDTVSQVVVLALRNILVADEKLQRVGVNGHVRAIDPATGEWEYPCLISVDTAREDFPREEALHNVDAVTCLKRLKAIISHHPYDLEPIEPVLDFDLTKFAFVEGLDAVASLDSRPNLLKMSPTSFEHLVRQLFEAQGAEGWTTTQSNDDGVDAVILNRSNLVGGLAIVQAKRYKPDNVLGPNHYRELAGTMEEKKAGWGVLITTSRFTAGCEQKAREHGRMQLIDGSKLKWMVKEYLGKDVLIG
jgi:restriction system protein